jgi:hypothetical protein
MRMMKLYIAVFVALAGLANVGCAKKMEGGTNPYGYQPNGPYIPPGNGPGQLPGPQLPDQTFQYGGTATLTVSSATMSRYLGWTPNVLTDVKMNVNVQQYTDKEGGKTFSGWGGTVTVAFKNDGVYYEDNFSSLVNPYGTVTTNGKNNRYNNWQTGGPAGQYFHGFFQDNFGAVIVVIDEVIDLGDGQGPQSVSGSVWVKNHPLAYAPLSPTSCWNVSLGPYDCRTWKSGQGVDPTAAIYPLTSDGYFKLGDFDDLDVSESFNDGFSL